MGESGKQSILAEKFIADFSSKKTIICGRIEKLSSGTSCDVNDELTSVSNEIQKLNKSLHDSVMFLPSYSVKVRQNEIRDLEKLLKEKEDLLLPKKRFGFKTKIIPKVHDENEAVNTPKIKDEDKPIQADDNKMTANFCTVEDLNCVTSTHEEDQLNGNDVLLRNLTGSTVYLNGSPSTLRLKNIESCKIICGPVQTSVFIENCKNSTFYICCQQLRTHSSEKIDIYLRVSSRAIIEDCHNIRFGPYVWNHPKTFEFHAKAGIDQNLERFDAVDDFNWLSAESKSPNWMIIPTEERIVPLQ